jgi:uncharacterized protein DUF3500
LAAHDAAMPASQRPRPPQRRLWSRQQAGPTFPRDSADVLPASAQKYVTHLIAAYVGDVPPAIAKPLIARYKKQYSRTYVSYAGGTTDTPGTYLRVDGPQAWIEFAVQSTDKGSSHYHSVFRDKKHDYGA